MHLPVLARWLMPVLLALGAACTPSAGSPPEITGASQGGVGGSSRRPPTSEPGAGGGGASGGGAGSSGTGGTSGVGGTSATGGGPGTGGGGAGGGNGGPRPGGPEAGPPSPRDAAMPPGSDPDASVGSGADGAVAVGPPPTPPVAFRSPGIVAYWGQNAYSARNPDVTRYEKSLADTCRDNPHYEMIVIGFIIEFFSMENVDRTPRTNFSSHCNSMMAFDTNHRRLYKCDEIGRGVNECQRLNRKVLLSLGGAVAGPSGYGFPGGDNQARMFAQTTWDLFLGGQSNLRPFGTAVLDGIDLDIESGGSTGYTAYVRRLRELMAGDGSRKWYVTGAPQCPFPDAFLGPAPGRALGDVPQLFDFLFVQFYNNGCGGSNLTNSFNQWAGVGPKILVGLPARPEAALTGFLSRAALPAVLNRVKVSPAFAGVMLWDASYDQNSVDGGMTYSAFVKTLLP